jgi:hypothetical protein
MNQPFPLDDIMSKSNHRGPREIIYFQEVGKAVIPSPLPGQ